MLRETAEHEHFNDQNELFIHYLKHDISGIVNS